MRFTYAVHTGPEELSVNVKLFDIQHKRLLDLITKLESAMFQRRANLEVTGILSEVADYAAEHFATEEAVMKAFEYPWRDMHTLEHRQFLVEIGKLQAQCNSGDVAVSVTLLYHLREWIGRHLIGSDRMYSEHLNSRGMY
jgi:hemerythrin-like metal-binding protein